MEVRVEGGTNAGWKRLQARARDWVCSSCGAKNRYHWVKCPACHAPRPKK